MASWEEEVVLSDNGVAGLLVKSPFSFAYVSHRTGKPFWKRHTCVVYWPMLLCSWTFSTHGNQYKSPEEDHPPPSQLPWHHQLNGSIERTHSAFRFDFFASWLNFHLPILTWVTPNTTACVIGPQAGIACCVHKLIAIRIVILTRSSWDRVSLIPSLAARVILRSSPLVHQALYTSHDCNLRKYRTNVWLNVLAARVAQTCRKLHPPTIPTTSAGHLHSPLNMDGRHRWDQCHAARVCE